MAHESTTAYIQTAQTEQAATHPAVRDLLRSANTVIASFQAGVAAQRAAYMSMQLDETDPRITGLFVELLDLLKTCDRLSGEFNDRLTQIPALLDRQEAMVLRLSSVEAAVLAG